MLVLSPRVGEKIVIGESVVLTVLAVRPGAVRLGIERPCDMPVHRAEVWCQMRDLPAPRDLSDLIQEVYRAGQCTAVPKAALSSPTTQTGTSDQTGRPSPGAPRVPKLADQDWLD